MPRVARIYTEEGIFHILTRGNNRQWIFHEEEDFQKYRDLLKIVKEEQPFKLYHYCLMNNHVHLIIETNTETLLSRLMKRINLSYYNYYKRKYGYSGHFWQDRYKSLLIERDEYLLACGLYIERNPIRAKIINSAESYKYSSFRVYTLGEEDGITDKDPFYEGLGETVELRQERYKRLILDREKELTERIFNQLYLGTEKFIGEMEEKFKQKNIRGERGRPKK